MNSQKVRQRKSVEKQRNGLDKRLLDKQWHSTAGQRCDMEWHGHEMIRNGSDVRWTGDDERCIAAETLGEDGIRVETN